MMTTTMTTMTTTTTMMMVSDGGDGDGDGDLDGDGDGDGDGDYDDDDDEDGDGDEDKDDEDASKSGVQSNWSPALCDCHNPHNVATQPVDRSSRIRAAVPASYFLPKSNSDKILSTLAGAEPVLQAGLPLKIAPL